MAALKFGYDVRGMYDEVRVRCLCGGYATFQSKAGECILAMYDVDEVPAAIAADLNGEVSECERCSKVCEFSAHVLVSTKWRHTWYDFESDTEEFSYDD